MGNPYSSLKIFHHKEALDAIEQGKRTMPFYIRIKPTNLCNHHCAYCTYGRGQDENRTKNRDAVVATDTIPWEKMQEIIKDIGEGGVKAVTFSGGGEPLTYPHIGKTVQKLKTYGIEISLISNGQLLCGELAKLFYGANWVRISFDSPNEEEYRKLRHVSAEAFRQVCKNINDFAEHKARNCELGVNFVVSKANAHRVYEAAKFLKERGVDNVKFAAVVDNHPQYHAAIKDNVIRQIHQAQDDLAGGRFHIINSYEETWMDKNFTIQSFPVCYTCRFVTVIGADCRVYLCHTRAYDSHAVLGDLQEQSFKEMWFSEETTKKLNELRPMRDCKSFCVYEERNQLVQAYLDVDPRHVNFI